MSLITIRTEQYHPYLLTLMGGIAAVEALKALSAPYETVGPNVNFLKMGGGKAVSLAEGTGVVGNGTTAKVQATPDDKQSTPATWKPSAAGAIELNDANLARWGLVGTNELGMDFMNTVVAEVLAAVPVGNVKVLPATGNAQFKAASPEDQILIENTFKSALAPIKVRVGNGKVVVLWELESLEYFMIGTQHSRSNVKLTENGDGSYSYGPTVTIWPVIGVGLLAATATEAGGATAFGSATASAVQCLIIGEGAYGFDYKDPYVARGGVYQDFDLIYKLTILSHMFHVVVDANRLAAVANHA